MLKNDYLVAKIGVDTAENEPSEPPDLRCGCVQVRLRLRRGLGAGRPRGRGGPGEAAEA